MLRDVELAPNIFSMSLATLLLTRAMYADGFLSAGIPMVGLLRPIGHGLRVSCAPSMMSELQLRALG